MSDDNPYDAFIMDHIKNARNYRALDAASHHANGINPLCGDEMTVYASVGEGRLVEVAFQCSCCGISMASASVMTEFFRAAALADVKPQVGAFLTALETAAGKPVNCTDPAQLMLLEAVHKAPGRRKCAALPWLTLDAALDGRPQAIATGD